MLDNIFHSFSVKLRFPTSSKSLACSAFCLLRTWSCSAVGSSHMASFHFLWNTSAEPLHRCVLGPLKSRALPSHVSGFKSQILKMSFLRSRLSLMIILKSLCFCLRTHYRLYTCISLLPHEIVKSPGAETLPFLFINWSLNTYTETKIQQVPVITDCNFTGCW